MLTAASVHTRECRYCCGLLWPRPLGTKLIAGNNNGITVAGWIESGSDESTARSLERINRGSRRRVLRCAC